MNRLNYLKSVLVCMIGWAVMLGCQKENLGLNELASRSVDVNQLVVDTAFLGFEGDLVIPEVIWDNIDIYNLAYDRMARYLQFKENTISWKLKSAQEINISPNIYDYIISGWRQDSAKLATGDYRLEVSGIYYKLVPKRMYTLSKAAPPVMPSGDYAGNMSIAIRLVRSNFTGFIWNAVDFRASGKVPDVYGGWIIRGMQNCDNLYWGYAIFYPVPDDPDSEFNSVQGARTDEYGNLFYEKLVNNRQSPLVSVLNAHLFLK